MPATYYIHIGLECKVGDTTLHICLTFKTFVSQTFGSAHTLYVEFYLYPTVITVLIHLIKPELIR